MDAKAPAAALLDGWLSEHELAAELNRHTRTLKRWRDAHIGPPFSTVGETPMYSIDAVRRWLAAGGTASAARARRAKR